MELLDMPNPGFLSGHPHEADLLLHLRALAQEKAARERQWLDENREAIEYCTKDFEENGLLLAEFLTF